MAYCIINLLFETQLPFYNFILYYIYDFSSFHNIIRIACGGYISFSIPIIAHNIAMAYNHDRFAVRIFVDFLCAQQNPNTHIPRSSDRLNFNFAMSAHTCVHRIICAASVNFPFPYLSAPAVFVLFLTNLWT